MAYGASELIEFMRDHWMRAKWLIRNIRQAGFFQSNVATCAPVDDPQFRQPDLLDTALEVSLQRVRIAAVADHSQIPMLVVPPLAKEILRRRDRQRCQEDQADHPKRAHTISE